MALSQNREVVPPQPGDKDFSQFAEIIQGNFRDVFQDAHRHTPLTAAPANSSGQPGDIYIVSVSGTYYLYAKVNTTTWKRVALS